MKLEEEILNPPVRIHVLLAIAANKALIIRRGPSRQVAFIGWDLKNNTFELGQWFKGRVYAYRSDLSSDGKHILYFAMGKRSETYNVLSKFPYFKAIDFYKKYDAWNGGGLFVNNKRYWLNDTSYNFIEQRVNSSFTVDHEWNHETTYMGECPGIYFKRLSRDGWIMVEVHNYARNYQMVELKKTIDNKTKLIKYFHIGVHNENNKSPYYESHALKYNEKDLIVLDDWEWADLIKSKIVYSKEGVIYSTFFKRGEFTDTLKLLDTNEMTFEEKVAPY